MVVRSRGAVSEASVIPEIYGVDAVMGLTKTGGRLSPAEDVLDALADPPTDRIAGVAGRPPVDCRAPVGGVLRHMRRHVVLSQIANKPGHIIGLVGAQRDPPR